MHSDAAYSAAQQAGSAAQPSTTKSRHYWRLKIRLFYEEPAATYSPRGLPPKYHRR